MGVIGSLLRIPGNIVNAYEAATRNNGTRRSVSIERGGEDDALSPQARGRMIAMLHEAMRNAPQARAIAQQMRVLIVGTAGGKVTCATGDDAFDTAVNEYMRAWSRCACFETGDSLSELLKLGISELCVGGGDFVAVHDDGMLSGGTGTGRIKCFESDCIGEPSDSKGTLWERRGGLLYTEDGRRVGVCVSERERGKSIFDAKNCIKLAKEDPADDANWLHVARRWRFAQGRGISAQSAAIATLIDLHEIISSERASSKANAAIFAQVIDSVQGATPSPVLPGMGDVSGASENKATLDVGAFERNTGGIVMQPPSGARMELLDTKRPNVNMIQWGEFLLRSAASVHGLANVYASLQASSSYTAFRGEQSITQNTIEDWQQWLEKGLLAWIVRRVVMHAISIGKLNVTPPDGWTERISWTWPAVREVNEVDAQVAVAAKLRNLVLTYRDIHGPRWLEKLTQSATEIKAMADLGLAHPNATTTAGGVIAPPAANGE